MNNTTKILFTTLGFVVALFMANGIAKQSDDADYDIIESTEQQSTDANAYESSSTDNNKKQREDVSSQTKATYSDELLMTNVIKGGKLSAEAASFITLKRLAYTTAYNPNTKLPVWVSWHLKREHTSGPYKRNGVKFEEDEDVPSPRATNKDYTRSGYDRGHMCPAGDNNWSEQALLESFLYTNCCPQLHNLNSGDWRELEERCRTWAETYGDIYIVCGPLLMNKKHYTIGKNKVVVPEAFFKVILRTSGTPQAIGFVYRNETTDKKMKEYVNSVDEVERLTGLDFFSALPDNIEKKVEATADINKWN